jgi:Flp pilus assembly protein TadD
MSDVTAQPPPVDRTPTQAVLQLINAGRADDAVALLAGFLAEYPADVPALGLLSLAQLRAQRWDEALLAADQAIGLEPTYSPAWQRRAIALIELDRTADAEAAATEHLRLAPDDWHAHYTVARVLRSVRGRRQEALRHARHAVELAPDDADAHNLLGVICRSLEDRAGAERAYRAALAIDPAHALARSNLALLTLGKAGTEEVMAGLRAAAESDPQQAAIHRNMALVAVLGLVRKGTWLALADLMVIWVTLAFASGPGTTPARLVVCALVLLSWLVLIGWWLRGLRPYLRSLVRGALGRLLRSSDARWGISGIAISVVCGAVALLWPAAGLGLVALGYLVQIAGSAISRRLASRRRRNALGERG